MQRTVWSGTSRKSARPRRSGRTAPVTSMIQAAGNRPAGRRRWGDRCLPVLGRASWSTRSSASSRTGVPRRHLSVRRGRLVRPDAGARLENATGPRSPASSRSASSTTTARSRPCSAARSRSRGSRPTGSAVAARRHRAVSRAGQRCWSGLPGDDRRRFGLNPEGVSPSPRNAAGSGATLTFADGQLALGDRLFLATDALAAWMARHRPGSTETGSGGP